MNISRMFLIPLITLTLLSPMAAADAAIRTAIVTEDTTGNESVKRLGKIIDDAIDWAEREILRQMGYGARKNESREGMEMTVDKYPGAVRFSGDVVINKRDRIKGDIIVIDGTLTVRGNIEGDVIVLNGDVIVEDGGLIDGSVTVVNGKITGDGRIAGEKEEKTGNDLEYTYRDKKDKDRNHYRLTSVMQEDLTVRDLSIPPFIPGYNRVDGLFLGLGSGKSLYWDRSMDISLYGQIGYAFRMHRWRIQLGGARQLPVATGQLIEIGAEVYSITETKDDWIIGKEENNPAAFFFNRDYYDYYDREGFSLYTGHYIDTPAGSGHIRVQYLNEYHRSLEKRTDWALFGGNRVFRSNPPIDEGRFNTFRIGLNFSTLQSSPERVVGWRFLTIFETTSPSLRSDFNFKKYVLDIRRYQPLSEYENLNIRIRLGTSSGALPRQRLFELGGLGTLTAFRHKEFKGSRMLLMNAEYILSGNVLNQLSFWPRGLLGRTSLILFVDSGWTGWVKYYRLYSDRPFAGFNDLSLNNMKTSIGFGIGSPDGRTRLGFAWRTDRSDKMVVFLRISRPF